ncbi:hydrolase [Sphingomonas daechungensis]|uniref:Hydrolase n=1 Tax=Sphingomonas daechungensis TaxID=1176646 RepID=A0ABX6T3H1_9SPHN|nr:hydrolase [Sphingomonas daechungensis]QNP43560.1 hydrolase [Sphingomonas daechungensis]
MGALSSQEQIVVERAAAEPMLDQVLAWAAVNSGSRNLDGLARMAGLLGDAFSKLPGSVVLVDAAPVDAVDAAGKTIGIAHGQNLHLKVRPEAPVQLLFTGHMDTVFAIDHPFQETRWLDDEVINGPGTADMKGGIAVMLAALKAVEASGVTNLGYEVIINSDEEVGSLGSAPLIAETARGKKAALTYEPSALPDGTLAGARPGSGNFAITIRGRSAHAGRNPDDGRNAVLAASDLALRFEKMRRAGLTVNPAKIDGGSPTNVVPDLAILRVNLRPATPELEAEANDMIAAAIAAVAAERDVHIDIHGGFARPPKPMTPAAEALFGLVKQAGADLGQSIGWQPSGGVCDGNNIAACGVPVVDTMGVRGGKIHSTEEFLIVESLKERAALSALTILRLAGGAA